MHSIYYKSILFHNTRYNNEHVNRSLNIYVSDDLMITRAENVLTNVCVKG